MGTDGVDPRVVVDGDVVRRPVHAWTPTVHALLRHLRSAGMGQVPEPLGVEGGADGAVELLRFVPGDAGARCWPHHLGDDGLRSAARLLRAVHDATASFIPPPDAVWGAPGAREPSEVICHGDPAPWNMVWRSGIAVALFDWDLAYPGPRLDDVAYALGWFAPFRADDEAVRWHGFDAPPDRRHRVEVFAAAYGLASTDGLVDASIARQRLAVEHTRHLAGLGIEPQSTWVAAGLPAMHARLRWTVDNRHHLED